MKKTFLACRTSLLTSVLALSTLSLRAADNHTFGPESAKASMTNMIAGEGLAVTLFASEPMVLNPADMDIDAKGRVWVTEGVNYRSTFQKWGKIRPAGDRIVILEDTNGDGTADKEITFYQGNEINTALGICVLGDKVIVSCSPNIFVFTDANHDDKADGPPQVLFTEIKGVDHDHGVHAFVFGPDGKLYFSFGNSGSQMKQPDGSLVIDMAGNEVITNGKPYRQGLVFRCNMDGGEFETLGWNFRNNYEVAVDSFGTMWQSDNDDDGNKGVRINYVMEFGNYGYVDEMTGAGWSDAWKKAKAKGVPESEISDYHWHRHDPGVVPNLLQTGNGSPTGILFYEGRTLPRIFWNSIIHCDSGPRVVRAYITTNDGAGYKAEIKDVLTSKDTWYRPSDVCTAPDGSLYIADWNDAGVGGHNMADQKLETMTGRIYRVAAKGRKAHVPIQDYSNARGCVGALQSPNLATRYLAWSKLHGMQASGEEYLRKLFRSSDPYYRARALHLLARIKGSEKKYVEQGFKDKSSDVRIAALRIARELKMDVIPYVKMLANDPSPQIRRECAISLRHNQSSETPKLWATLAKHHDGKDRWYLEALGISADKQWDKYFDAWLTAVGDNWNTPAGRDLIWRSRSTKAPALLVKIVNDKNTPEGDRARYIRSLDFITGPEKEKALLDLLTSAAPGK